MDDTTKIPGKGNENDVSILQETSENEEKTKKKITSKRILDTMKDMKTHSDAKKIAEKIHHIGDLRPIYEKYEKEFSEMVARYAIKKIIDHEMEYGHYAYLHDNLLSHIYLNEQERHRIEKGLDTCALNYIQRHSIGSFKNLLLTTDISHESLYDFENLVKILSTEYISEGVRKEAEKALLKRVKNKKESGKCLLMITKDANVPEYIREEAENTLQKQSQMGTGKYRKQEK